MGLIDNARRLIGVAPAGTDVARPNPSSAYMRNNRHLTFKGWNPVLRHPQHEIASAWDKAAARTIDAVHNSGWLAGAIEQAAANTVGTGLRLKASPEADVLGWTKADARQWAKLVERRFEIWSKRPFDCDVEGRRTLGDMQADAFKHWIGTGEILHEIVWRRRALGTNGTKFRLLTPMRLSRRSVTMENLVNGVYLDRDGLAVGYAIRQKNRIGHETERRVRARDRYGRPMVVHVFNGPPETQRGITPIAPALMLVRQFDQLSDATLMASIVQTLFAATIKSDAVTEDVISGLLTQREMGDLARDGVSPFEAYSEMLAGYYEDADLDVGINGRIAHLFPGEEMEFHTAEHPNGNYPDFAKMILRELARCLGMTYESATGDYQGATYASLGRAIAEVHEVTKVRRNSVIAPASQPIYEAWLEAEIEQGTIPFPGGVRGFLMQRGAAARAIWRGGPKPIAEELKLAKAHETWLRLGVMSEQMIAAELGVDYEDVCAEREEARSLREEYDLDEPVMSAGGSAIGGNVQDDDEDDGGDDAGDA